MLEVDSAFERQGLRGSLIIEVERCVQYANCQKNANAALLKMFVINLIPMLIKKINYALDGDQLCRYHRKRRRRKEYYRKRKMTLKPIILATSYCGCYIKCLNKVVILVKRAVNCHSMQPCYNIQGHI